MRRTLKYRQAVSLIKRHKITSTGKENAEIYVELESLNWFWNAKQGVWEQRDHAPSTSIFTNDDGTPTGIVKVRLMCHPANTAAAVRALHKATGWMVRDVSDSTYPNRKGVGERVYAEVVLEVDV